MHRMGNGKDVMIMCAISGVIGAEVGDEAIQKMLQTMHRRGPDGQGVFREGDVTLLHARLAIIDPAGGKQPMAICWADEEYILIYNGELYNTEEVRHGLLQKGHRFLGHSDTEVVLHAYAEYADRCTERLNGIFAFAVWERKKHRLFLARDRIGVKPLFYMHRDHQLRFASEMKTILASGDVEAKLDETGAAQLILLGPGRVPGSGVFQDIQEVKPGCCGYFSNGKLTLRQYWKLRDREHGESFEETSECVRYLVTDAIRRQMVSDVPVGTFLSGGLDSSIITAICAEEMAQKDQKLMTFSLDYENNDRFFQANKFQPESDQAYIQLMRECLAARHRRTVLTPEDLVNALEASTIARDLPGMADVDFSLLAFCGQIRRDVKVALSGECADEIFGGYPWYRDPEVRRSAGFPWAQNTAQRLKLLAPALPFSGEEFVMEAWRETCRESDILPGTAPEERRMKEMVNLNFAWFMQTLLDRKDRMSMYHSLEVRVPFCDYRIAEYLYGVPWEYKDHRGQEKGLLRHAMQGLLPEKVLYRKKSPYPKTFDPRYEKMVTEQLLTVMEDKSRPIWHLIDQEAVRQMLETPTPWPWYGQLMRRPQTVAYLLQIDFWLRHYRVAFCF